jgi:hypothetical protein
MPDKTNLSVLRHFLIVFHLFNNQYMVIYEKSIHYAHVSKKIKIHSKFEAESTEYTEIERLR